MHDLNLATLFCERLLMLHKGRIVASGTPAEVLKRERIKEVYGVDAHFFKADGNGRFVIFPKV